MRPKSLVLLLLALGCGVVASIGITQVMAKRGADPAQAEIEPVVVAVADIPMGDPVAPQLVKLEEWPKDKVPKGALQSLEQIENRRPRSRIFAGSPIMDNQLLGRGVVDQGASDSIPKGMRVIAVKVDLVSGSASLIRPGDRVDVLVNLNRGGSDLSKSIAKTILQDIKVFAVDNVWETATSSGEKAIIAKTISLLVTPVQAEHLTLASEMGNVRLVMRSPDDKEQPKVPGAVAMDVLGGSGAGGMDRILASFVPSALPPEKPKSNPITGLLSLFNGSKKPKAALADAAPSAPPAKKAEVFTVRILSESHPMETVLELTGDKSADSESSFLHWKACSSASPAPAIPPPGPAAAKSAEDSPPEEPADESEEMDEPATPSQQEKLLDN